MAKDDFDSVVAAIKQQILDKMQSKEIMELVGETGRDLIYKRVKSGKGVASDTALYPETETLAPLKPSYIAKRNRDGVNGAFGSPRRSNLTNTGQMLESISTKFNSPGKITIEVPDTKRDDGKTNKELAVYARDGDPERNREPRPFFNLSRGEALVVSKTLSKIIEQLTRLFNR